MTDLPEIQTFSLKENPAGLAWIRHGDLLLFRAKKSLASRVIAIAGRGRYSHAAMAAWWGSKLLCLEIREWKGGRAVTLASQVERYPGQIEVFNIASEFSGQSLKLPRQEKKQYDRMKAVNAMMDMTGCDYGWWRLLGAAVRHMPFLRLLARPVENGDIGDYPPFCSDGFSIAAKCGGVDPCPQLANRITEPNDLSRSLLFESSGKLLVP